MSPPPPPPPPPRLSKPPTPLHKQKSLSTDLCREEAWLRRKDNNRSHLHRRSKSLITTEDIDELRGCVDLGFHFAGEPTGLCKTFPALDLYYATSSPATPIRSRSRSRSSSSSSSSSSSRSRSSSSSSSSLAATVSDCRDSPRQPSSPAANTTTTTLFNSGESPEMVKRRLKQWAQVVACAARQPACHQVDLRD